MKIPTGEQLDAAAETLLAVFNSKERQIVKSAARNRSVPTWYVLVRCGRLAGNSISSIEQAGVASEFRRVESRLRSGRRLNLYDITSTEILKIAGRAER